MSIERLRSPMSVDRFLSIQGKIVSRSEGIARKHIRENFEIRDGQFIQRNTVPSKGPGICVAKDPADDKESYLNYLSTNLGFIQENTQMYRGSKYEPTRFNPVQAFLMNSNSQFLWINKTRQFGFSLMLAARALAKAMLKQKHTSIFISYNEEESKEKIVYAKELYDSMPNKWKLSRRLKYDNKTNLVFEKAGPDSFETRILSYPQRIVRGKGGEIDIDFDEAAHWMHLRKIYTSAMPALSRGANSSLWMGSSPAGKAGLFYEIGVNQDNEYSPFMRINAPWWVIEEFCTNVKTASQVAWDMHTDERVSLFATDRLKMIRKTMTLDDFRQEYECEYLDESYSYFPQDLIDSCTPIYDVDGSSVPAFDSPAEDLSQDDIAIAGRGIEHYTDFDRFLEAIRAGHIKGSLLGGFDVGRVKDASEIYYLEEDPNTFHQTCRCNISLSGVSLPEQRRIVLSQFAALGAKLKKFGVDYNGIGCNIAEDLQELSYEMVEKLHFNSNEWKEEACRRFKIRMSKQMISLPTDRKVKAQIHSIKRILLPSGAWRFDVEQNSKHHGDKFWAIIAASEVGQPVSDGTMATANAFDRRLATIQQSQGRRPGVSIMNVVVINPSRMGSMSRFNPWGSMMPAPPSMPMFNGMNNMPNSGLNLLR